MSNRAHNNPRRVSRGMWRQHRKLLQRAFMGYCQEKYPEVVEEFVDYLNVEKRKARSKKTDELTIVRDSGLLVAKGMPDG